VKLPPRAAFAALALAFALAGCSSAPQSLYGKYFQIARQAWSAQFGDQRITRAQAAAISYASMGFRINGGRQQIIVLATDSGGEMVWTAASRIVLATRNGRLWRSVGLPHDLGNTTAPGTLPPPAQAMTAPFRSVRQMDFPDAGLYGVTLTCSAVLRGRVSISILGATIPTARVDESCRASGTAWSFTDSFWIDPQTGMVWEANLHVHPSGQTLQTQILRPPG